jgi:hypothetical protein
LKGSVIKRGRRWYATVDLERVNGKRKQKRILLDPVITKKKAEAELARILTELNSGEFVAPSNLTVTKLLTEHWLPHAKATRVKPPALKSVEMLCLDERQSLELMRVAKGQSWSLSSARETC